jgi:2-amino-4-hydroxy-6-hydroxymethyldihydropteridine diphosphokinase
VPHDRRRGPELAAGGMAAVTQRSSRPTFGSRSGSPSNKDRSILYIGLGSNLGCRGANLGQAIEGISNISRGDTQAGVRLVRASSVYETEPWGLAGQRRFLNQVLESETAISPFDLLNELQTLEKELGREAGIRYGPRVIDIDILLYGGAVVDEPELQIPHPRLHQRAFVLVPLSELAPDLVHPALGVSIRDLCRQVEGKAGVKPWVRSKG